MIQAKSQFLFSSELRAFPYPVLMGGGWGGEGSGFAHVSGASLWAKVTVWHVAVHKSLWEGQSGDKLCNTLNNSNVYTTERVNISYYCNYSKIWQYAKSHISKTFGRKTTRSKWPKFPTRTHPCRLKIFCLQLAKSSVNVTPRWDWKDNTYICLSLVTAIGH